MSLSGIETSAIIINLIMAIPIFFILKWVLKKVLRQESRLRTILTWAGTLVLTPIIYIGLISIIIFSIYYYPKKQFNEITWRMDKEKRYEMSEDLIEKEILPGKTKEEVKNILGAEFYKYDENHWSFDLGSAPGLINLDPNTLDIYFKDEKVQSVRHING